jgi:hypothetical protein
MLQGQLYLASPPCVSRLFTKCSSRDFSQPYGPPSPVTGIAWRAKLTSPPSVSRLSRENVGASTSHNPVGLHGLLQGKLCLTSSPSVSRFSRKCGSLDVSQPYGPSRPVTGRALSYLTANVSRLFRNCGSREISESYRPPRPATEIFYCGKYIVNTKKTQAMLHLTSPPSMSRLFRNCGSREVSESYGPPRPVTGRA